MPTPMSTNTLYLAQILYPMSTHTPRAQPRAMPTPAHLQREHHQGHTDHDDHQQLRGPDLGGDIPVAHGRKGDNAEVEGREQGQVLARTLQVLDPASPGGCQSSQLPRDCSPLTPRCCRKVPRTQDWGHIWLLLLPPTIQSGSPALPCTPHALGTDR